MMSFCTSGVYRSRSSFAFVEFACACVTRACAACSCLSACATPDVALCTSALALFRLLPVLMLITGTFTREAS